MTASVTHAPGTLVTARGRDWIVLPPGDDPDVIRLRPLGAPDAHATGLSRALEGDTIRSATLDLPDPTHVGDHVSLRLLRDAARLAFRNGASPLRSLAHVNLDPRPYQLVPLLMALRQDPVRLLVGDDVGIGKTIESGLIARELLDRGEIRRVAVLCPAQLCEQWADELWRKFHIRADVIRPGTLAALDRELDRAGRGAAQTVFDAVTHMVVSIDYVKAENRIEQFVRGCPELVIVDEAHGVARPGRAGAATQQQRHDLVRRLAADPRRHVILATATPHSGDQGAFASLVGLLRPDLEAGVAATGEGGARMDDALRDALRAHVVLRRRDDVRAFGGRDTAFPKRENAQAEYALDTDQLTILRDTVVACRAYIEAGGTTENRQRLRYWAALALLRCVASSPAAALAALDTRLAPGPRASLPAVMETGTPDADHDRDRAFDHGEDDAVPAIDAGEGPGANAVQARFRALRDRIQTAVNQSGLKATRDQKFVRTANVVTDLLRRGHNPIIFCRYLATARYVADALGARIDDLARAAGVPKANLGIACITGDTPPDDRADQVEALAGTGGEPPTHPRRILVATDCLSEGINLQRGFDAVVHYDMAWNLTRHDQRAGRVDRFGQPVGTVRVVLVVGTNNALDQAVLRVWMRRAANIQATLGVSVPVPFNYVDILRNVFDAVLMEASATQLQLLSVEDLGIIGRTARAGDAADLEWQEAEARVKRERGHFVQAAIRPDDVLRTLDEAEAALGAPADVRRFVVDAGHRLTGATLAGTADEPALELDKLPPGVRGRLDLPELTEAPAANAGNAAARNAWRRTLTFDAARARPGVEIVTRTHPIVDALAGYLLDTALEDPGKGAARRAGATRTEAVSERTAVLLLRTRTLLHPAGGGAPLLAEETFFAAAQGDYDNPTWLPSEQAAELGNAARPAGNLDAAVATSQVASVCDVLPRWQAHLDRAVRARATTIRDGFEALRRATRDAAAHRAEPVLPADILGIHVLVPVPGARPAGAAR
jgi:superfamily II DNA or RNA helicase